jgi:hypothetical protein
MDWMNLLDRFEFDKQSIGNNQIRSEAFLKVN